MALSLIIIAFDFNLTIFTHSDIKSHETQTSRVILD